MEGTEARGLCTRWRKSYSVVEKEGKIFGGEAAPQEEQRRAENGIVGATGEFGVTFGDKAPETCNLNVFK